MQLSHLRAAIALTATLACFVARPAQADIGERALAIARRFDEHIRPGLTRRAISRGIWGAQHVGGYAVPLRTYTVSKLARRMERVSEVGDDQAPTRAFELAIEHGGRRRVARVRLPRGYDPSRREPLLFDLHGYGNTERVQAEYTGMEELGPRRRYITVHPASAALDRSWNVGLRGTQANFVGYDDAGFLVALVDSLRRALNADVRRVFATGFSMGAKMTFVFAREAARRGIETVLAPVGGYDVSDEPAVRDVPIMQTLGADDWVVPATPGLLQESVGIHSSANFALDRWLWTNRIYDDPQPIEHKRSTTSMWRGAGDLVLMARTIRGLAHGWPGDGRLQFFTGYPPNRRRFTESVLDWFDLYRLDRR